jgi:small subunit ribosomal protein S3e
MNTVMKFGEAVGCEVIVSGKMRVQRAKCMKYKSGYCISTGQPKLDFLDVAVRHCFFKQGIIGVKVKIMIPHDPHGKRGTKMMLPDTVKIEAPKDNDEPDVYPQSFVQGTPAPQEQAQAQQQQ